MILDPPGRAAVIMRFGRYLRTQGEGRTFLRPITDRTATIEAAIRLQVIDAKAASGRWGVRVVPVDITAVEPVRHDGREYTSEGKL